MMEYFAWDPAGLAVLSGHYSTGEPLPPHLVELLRASKHSFVGLETQQQVQYKPDFVHRKLLPLFFSQLALHVGL